MQYAVKFALCKQIKERGTNAVSRSTSPLKEVSLVRLRIVIGRPGNSSLARSRDKEAGEESWLNKT